MTADTFIQNFDLLAESPGGVPKLRELILQLAVRGKLVEQEKGERKGKIHHAEHEEKKEGERVEWPYALPAGWRWTTLGVAVDYNYGEKVDSQDIPGDAWLLDLEDVEKDTSRLIRRVRAGERQSTSTKSQFKAGDVLYGKLRPYLNKVLVADNDGYCTTEIVPMRPADGIDPAYVVCTLKSRNFLDYAAARSYGMKMPRLGTEDAKRAPFPLPPLPEQKRIVARVDELMKRCDELEARQKERDDKHQTLVSACLNRLASPVEGETAVSRERGNGSAQPRPPSQNHPSTPILQPPSFNLLFTSPESVAELRKTILQLAVQGRLVKQEKIHHEGHEGEKEGETIEGPYPIPQGWRWTKLGDIGEWGAGATPSRANSEYYGGAIPWFKSGELGDNSNLMHSEEHVTERALEKCSLRENRVGDVLIAMYGATIGKLAILGCEGTTNQAVCACTCNNHILNLYLYNVLLAMRPEFTSLGAGAAQPNISKIKIVNTVIALPPLDEQKRIVAKVNELMDLCDALEAKLTQSRADADTLTAAMIHAFGFVSQNGK